MDKLSEDGKKSHHDELEKEVKEFDAKNYPKSAKLRPSKMKSMMDLSQTNEDEDRLFVIENVKNIPCYASVLNNPKKSNFLSALYAATEERPFVPEMPEAANINDFQGYINKIQKSYDKYMKFHKKGQSIPSSK